MATKGLNAGTGITLSSTATDITIAADVAKFPSLALTGDQTINHDLGTTNVIISVKSASLPLPFVTYIHGTDYTYTVDDADNISIVEVVPGGLGTYSVTVIG